MKLSFTFISFLFVAGKKKRNRTKEKKNTPLLGWEASSMPISLPPRELVSLKHTRRWCLYRHSKQLRCLYVVIFDLLQLSTVLIFSTLKQAHFWTCGSVSSMFSLSGINVVQKITFHYFLASYRRSVLAS